MKKSRFNSIFTKRPTKCCCCIPFRPGTIILCILLFINGIWNASIFLSEIAAYCKGSSGFARTVLFSCCPNINIWNIRNK
ncbi:hypothetical protein RhiirA4_149589 [Rhizophagus irregularis]|uniref:Uncharacterized protein n=1 Tax=Rhizophagus irregularis TaxID=588596 RepID=A0A2I1GD74_9GLOM|nr:hypothetical protein RhiirA4_149589 [Rhizophagus irregularis]